MWSKIRKALVVLLSAVLCFSSVASSDGFTFDENSDAFVEIKVNGINVNPIQVIEIVPKDIVVNSINVREITNIEIEVVSVNDEMVTLAYENFVSYYGEDFDLSAFLKDVAIGSSVVIVMVTLSTVAGPVGTFFGAVITSEFTASALVIGAAIDAAVDGWKAYQDGGDLSYILGHMLNGVAEGYKWSAFLAPVTGAFAGIKALRAVKHLRKIPGFEEIEHKAARKLFKQLPEIIKQTSNLSSSLADDVLRKAYKDLPSSLTSEIAEDLFVSLIRNKSTIINIVKRFNPFNISKDLMRSLQKNFWDKANVEETVAKDLIDKIKRRSIKSISNIDDDAIREYVQSNLKEFLECYSSSLPKEFLENCLEESISHETLIAIKKTISHNDNYVELIKALGKENVDSILDNPDLVRLLQARFKAVNVQRLRDYQIFYRSLSKNTSDEAVDQLIEGILNTSIKSLDDIARIDSTLADNVLRASDLVTNYITRMGLEKRSSSLLTDLAVNNLMRMDLTREMAEEIVLNHMTKAQIRPAVYRELLDHYNLSVQSLAKAKGNKTLITELTSDALHELSVPDNVITSLLKGESLEILDLSSETIIQIGPVLSDFYYCQDSAVYYNFVREYAELRGHAIESFLAEYEIEFTITNKKFAGCLMTPAGENADYILERYGDIYMTTSGFPIFDDYAISRLVLPDLTGIDAEDIAVANLIHHGTTQSIPGYTWHHLEDGKTLILIPTELHEAYRHTGGASLIREGLGRIR